MEDRKLNLRLPLTQNIRTSSERPSSRTDKLVDSFSSEAPKGLATPRLSASSSNRDLPSVGKLKELLQKTSNRLKGLQSKGDLSRNDQREHKDLDEISRLRREVRILELEK